MAGAVFAGLKFFLVHKLPARSQLLADIEAHGGSVVRREKHADYVIADHARRDAPAGSYSWTLLSTAIRHGAMPDPADHPAGPRPGSVREPASGAPAKSKRTAFTLEDDRELWLWVQEQAPGGVGVKGHEIYKRLEQRNPRHTLQSWRDRYLQKLMDHPPPGVDLSVPASSPPSLPTAPDEQAGSDVTRTPLVKRRRVEASPEQADDVDDVERPALEQDQIDMDLLLQQAPIIEEIRQETHDETWCAWSIAYPHRSADEWVRFWRERVRPRYVEQCADRKVEESAQESSHEHKARKRKRHSHSSHDDDEPNNATLVQPQLDNQLESGESEASNQQPAFNIIFECDTSPNQDPGEETIEEDDGMHESVLKGEPTPRKSTTAPSPIVSKMAQVRVPPSPLAERDKPFDDNVLSMIGTDGTALTEANLAAQEAQYKPSVCRGIDLVEDESTKDQTELLEYLRELSGGKPGPAPTVQKAVSCHKPVSQGARTDEQATESLEHLSQQPRSGNDKATANAKASASDNSHDDEEGLSDHDIDLSVALPDHEMGFGPSSDHNSQGFMSEALPGSQQSADNTYRAYADENATNPISTAAISISSASAPSSPLNSSDDVDDALDPVDQAPTGRVLDTQDIYNAETQHADLFMPLPPGFEDDDDDDDDYKEGEEGYGDEQHHAASSERPDSPSPRPDNSQSHEEAALLESWMATMKVRGHDDGLVIQALKCTSMNLDLAELVVLHVKGGKGIPDDVPGVWTEEEDEQVEGGNARALRRLEAKHGWPACAARLRFLEEYRDE